MKLALKRDFHPAFLTLSSLRRIILYINEKSPFVIVQRVIL